MGAVVGILENNEALSNLGRGESVCNPVRVLAVTKGATTRDLVKTSLEAEGHEAVCVSCADEASRALNGEEVWDLVLLDMTKDRWLTESSASALVEKAGSEKVCIFGEIGDAFWESFAQARNIRHRLTKPLLRQDLERLISTCARPVEAPVAPVPCRTMKDKPAIHLESLEDHSFFLAASPAMLQLHKNIRKLATVDHPVLILGESGVGKEVVARLLHKYQATPDKKFVNVNTAAIPSELLESELFGYEVGAFTGAVKAKPGKFELANKGTILLDEIGEMSPLMQAKLLHVLQDGSFTRLGGRASQRVDVRILAATNVNMETAIAEKRFREDLYYRISTFTLTVPSLRERREEIPLLIEQMALRGAASAGQEAPHISARLMEAAQEYHWPGNLRELRNFVTRLLVLQDEEAAYEQLRAQTRARSTHASAPAGNGATATPPPINPTGMKGVVSDLKQRVESSMIKEALQASGWNRRRAASNLNISYRALLYKIQQHGLSA